MSEISTLSSLFSLIKTQDLTNTLGLAGHDTQQGLFSVRKLPISLDLGKTFVDIASQKVQAIEKLRNEGDLRLVNFDLGYKPDSHEIEYIKINESLSKIISNIPKGVNINLTENTEEEIKKLRFYFLLLENHNKKIIFFRRHNKSRMLVKSKNILIKLCGDYYEKFSDPIMQFDQDFDAIFYDDYIFILNKYNFQYIFQFYEFLKDEAEAALDIIERNIPINNFNEFKDSCLNHLQKLEKLKNISQKDYISRVTIKEIKDTINKFNLNIKFISENGIEKIVFDKSDRWTILNLLDDAYLGSEMTGINYEVNSKHKI